MFEMLLDTFLEPSIEVNPKTIAYPYFIWNRDNRDYYGASLVLFILKKMGVLIDKDWSFAIYRLEGGRFGKFSTIRLGSFKDATSLKKSTQRTLTKHIETLSNTYRKKVL